MWPSRFDSGRGTPSCLFSSSFLPIVAMPFVLLRPTIFVLSISTSTVFSIYSIVVFAHVFHEPAKLPVLNAHFNLPLQIITIIYFVPMIFMIFTVMVLVSLITQGLHLEGGRLRILLPFMRAYISFGDFSSSVKFSRFGEYALVDQEQPNRFGTLILRNQSSCSFPFPLFGLLVSSLFLW